MLLVLGSIRECLALTKLRLQIDNPDKNVRSNDNSRNYHVDKLYRHCGFYLDRTGPYSTKTTKTKIFFTDFVLFCWLFISRLLGQMNG